MRDQLQRYLNALELVSRQMRTISYSRAEAAGVVDEIHAAKISVNAAVISLSNAVAMTSPPDCFETDLGETELDCSGDPCEPWCLECARFCDPNERPSLTNRKLTAP